MSRTIKKKTTTPGLALARPGDPLVLGDGTILHEEIYTNPLKPNQTDPINIQPSQFRPLSKRVIKDFPSNEQMFKAIGVVFAYTLYGISNSEICESLGITLEQVTEIREHQGYTDLFNATLSEFISTNSDILQSRIAAYSSVAVTRIGHLVENAKKEEVQLAAGKDILDRAGMRPQDLQASQQSSMNELQIRITKKTDDVIVDVKVGKPHGNREENTDNRPIQFDQNADEDLPELG